MDYIWLILLLVFFIPVLQQRMLHFRRQRSISNLETKRDSRVIMLVHRQESMKFFGIPMMRYIDINDSEEILKAIQMTDSEVPVDLVLHTPGGLVLPSLQIARAIKHHDGKVTAFVPHFSMSGGTLIALAADEIVMSPHAVLGPVDPQIDGMPAASIVETTKHKPVAELDDETLIKADVSKKAINQMCRSVVDLLPDSIAEENREQVADLFSRGAWTHDYPLHAEALQGLGLQVSTDVPEEFLDLMTLYPQPSRSDGVEFTPFKRGSGSGEPSGAFPYDRG